MKPRFTPVADFAILVTFSDEINDEVHAAIVAFDQAIAQCSSAASPSGIIEVVPALVNVMVTFDPVVTDHARLEAALRKLLNNTAQHQQNPYKRTVQVCYDESFAFDMDAVAKACKLTHEAVVNAHLAGNYKVLMYGFVPGYAYMGGVGKSIQVPRKTAAVRDIPAGSVIIAGGQCLITTLKMPTGWSVIGRSPTQVLLDDPDRPFLFDVGDEVTFERIDLSTYEALSGSKTNG